MELVNSKNFDEVISNGYVLVDFYADWCGPCKMISPVLEDLSKNYEGKINFVKLNVDMDGTIAQRFNVMSIPTIKIFKDGEIVREFMGYMPKPQIEKLLDSIIA